MVSIKKETPQNYFKVNSVRLTTNEKDCVGHFTDSCVLFIFNRKKCLGFITLILDEENILCINVIHGRLDSNQPYLYIRPEKIIEQLVHVFDTEMKSFIFFRLPNFVESYA